MSKLLLELQGQAEAELVHRRVSDKLIYLLESSADWLNCN